ncbi:dihydrofolate reductase family protein [Nocardia sp. alder85J]|uniref:dihydrofolate reductase family protein n=1 Tax=Nocardia sp. alder85J TaxID=2862949 RepID=UPI001CD5BCEF|nr:dihydrofolate reductase family protein [Nocardia sp. alder85J]MCX4095490.1 dihydrofolate reductase family protein [Nocardia sp. alder85J]
MGTIVVSENITLDGVVQDPTGEEGFTLGGWFNHFTGADREQWSAIEHEEARNAAALLLGRRTYEWFATRWAPRPGDWADRLRALPKYVVASAALDGPDWNQVEVVKGDVVEEVSALKARVDGEVVVYGSRLLVQALLAHDLVDELRLTTFPYLLGSGARLFDEIGPAMRPLNLVASRAIGTTLALRTYRPVRDA